MSLGQKKSVKSVTKFMRSHVLLGVGLPEYTTISRSGSRRQLASPCSRDGEDGKKSTETESRRSSCWHCDQCWAWYSLNTVKLMWIMWKDFILWLRISNLVISNPLSLYCISTKNSFTFPFPKCNQWQYLSSICMKTSLENF